MSNAKWLDSKLLMVTITFLAVVVMLHSSFTPQFYELDDEMDVQASLSHDWSNFQLLTSAMPLARLSYRIDYYLFRPSTQQATLTDTVDLNGLKVWAPAVRCMSGFYHLCAALLLWLFLRRIEVPPGTAMLVAFLWAAHPGACECVCWVAERKSILCALFGFAALLIWAIKDRPIWRLPVAYGLYLLAHLCKISALGFLPLLFAVELLDSDYHNLQPLTWQRWRIFLRREAVPILITGAALVLALHNYGNQTSAPPGGNTFTSLMTDTVILIRYIFNTFIPVRLSFFYGIVPVTSILDIRVWICGLLLVGFALLSIKLTDKKHRPLAVLGIAWFIGALGPNLNLISSPPFWMQDRYIYIAMPGLLLTGALVARSLLYRFSVGERSHTYIACSTCLLMVLLLGYRATFFSDSRTLELDASEKEPNSSFAQLCAAGIFVEHYHNARDQNQKRLYGIAAARKINIALNCPDLRNFREPFELKLRGLDIYFELGDYEVVRESLNGWLPPSHFQMLNVVRNENPTGNENRFSRQNYLKGYLPMTLAHAWDLMAETTLRKAVSTTETSEKLAFSNEALTEASNALIIWDGDESKIVSAKASLYAANLDANLGNEVEALKRFDVAIEILNGIDPKSPYATVAQYLLVHARPPRNAQHDR